MRQKKNHLYFCVCNSVSISIFVFTSAFFSPYVYAFSIAGLDDNGDYAFSGGAKFTSARNALLNPANFGKSGVVNQSITLLPDILGEITTEKLVQVDLLVLGVGNQRSYSPSEANALYHFVHDGGNLLFSSDVGINFGRQANSLSAAFRVFYNEFDFNGTVNSGPSLTIDAMSHPLVNGPFGVSEFVPGASGSILSIDNGLSIASIAAGVSAGRSFMLLQDMQTGFPGIGKAIWLSDNNLFSNDSDLFSENETLFLNTMAYLVPEPCTLCILGLGVLGLRSRQGIKVD